MNKNSMHIAIVILNWNGKELLQQFLPSVLATNYPNFSVWLADNASTDDSVKFVKQNFKNVKIIELDKNHGFAGGYNKVLKKVEGDVFVLLNSDVEVTPNWLNPIAKTFEKNKNLAAAQPKIRWQRKKEYFEYAGASGGFMDSLAYTFCRGRIFDELEKDDGQYNDEMEIFWATGCAMFIRSEIYHNLGGLDDDFFAHMEEIDLCWRIKNCGYSIKVFPQSVVYHVGAATLKKTSSHKTYLNFRNNLAMLFKNTPTTQLFWKLPLRISLDKIAAIKFLLSGNFKEFLAVFKALFSFLFWIPKLINCRKQIKQIKNKYQVNPPNKKGTFNGIIVWKHFVKGVKRFEELKF